MSSGHLRVLTAVRMFEITRKLGHARFVQAMRFLIIEFTWHQTTSVTPIIILLYIYGAAIYIYRMK